MFCQKSIKTHNFMINLIYWSKLVNDDKKEFGFATLCIISMLISSWLSETYIY